MTDTGAAPLVSEEAIPGTGIPTASTLPVSPVVTSSPAPSVLWTRDFTLWLLGNAQSQLGSALAGIALSFLVLRQTGSSGAMGVTLALGLLPTLLGPLAGVLTDRLPLRLPLLLGSTVRMVTQLLVGFLALRGHVPLSLLNAVAFVNGAMAAVTAPASMSVLPGLVPRSQLARANGLMGSAQQTAGLLGLVGGGALVSGVGSAATLIMDGVSFAVLSVMLLFIRLPGKRGGTAKETGEITPARPSVLRDLRAGVRYMRGRAVLTLLLFIALLLNASLAPLELLLPRRMVQLGVGAFGFGSFFGLVTAGMLLVSAGVAVMGARTEAKALSRSGFFMVAASLLLLSVSGATWQLWGLTVLMGVGIGLTNSGIGILFGLIIRPEYRGRVSGVLGMLGSAGQPVTLLLLSGLADRVPLSLLFAVAGGVTLLGALAWSWALSQPERGETSSETVLP